MRQSDLCAVWSKNTMFSFNWTKNKKNSLLYLFKICSHNLHKLVRSHKISGAELKGNRKSCLLHNDAEIAPHFIWYAAAILSIWEYVTRSQCWVNYQRHINSFGTSFQFPKLGDASPTFLPARGQLDGWPELGLHMEQRSQVPFDNPFGSYMWVSVLNSFQNIYSVHFVYYIYLVQAPSQVQWDRRRPP